MKKHFNIGDFAVFAGHGVGQICEIQSSPETNLGNYYVIKLKRNGMKVLVPIDRKSSSLRALSDFQQINKVFDVLKEQIEPENKINNTSWNKRYKEYVEKVNTGNLLEIANVLKTLVIQKQRKNLSFSEKKLLVQCKTLIIDEIAQSNGEERNCLDEKIESCFV